MSLPPPVENQAYCDVSALEAGHIEIPLAWVIDTAKDDEKATLPALSFLLRHTSNHDTFVFDLGIRKDWETLPPAYVARIKKMGFRVSVPQDAATSLLSGGMPATDIAHVCLSHLHFDHTGDPTLFPRATFLAGAGGRAFLAPGYPADADSLFAGDLLPADRTRWLEPGEWPPLGPFAHALDFYGDGSLYVVDAGAGHFPGHVNVLARTSGDGGWVFLAGDSAHDRRLLTGEARIARHCVLGCAHRDWEAAEAHIGRVRVLVEGNKRVRVVLAHDGPWYEENINAGGEAFWPGRIESL